MSPVKKVEAHVVLSSEVLEDGRRVREDFARVAYGSHPPAEYRRRREQAWAYGYLAAIEDLRSGRLRFDKHGELVPGVRVG